MDRVSFFFREGNNQGAIVTLSGGSPAIKSDLAVQKTQITNEARSQLAEATIKAEQQKASVAPVLTNRAVYAVTYGDAPVAFTATENARNAREAVAQAKQLKREAPVVAKSPSVMNGKSDSVPPLIVADSFSPNHKPAGRNEVSDVIIASGVASAVNEPHERQDTVSPLR